MISSIALAVTLLTQQQEDFATLRKAYEHLGKRTSVSGEIIIEDFGQRERCSFKIILGKLYSFVQENRVKQSTPGEVVVYHPKSHSGIRSEVANSGIVVVNELWPFWNIGRPNSTGFGVSEEKPRRATFLGKRAWEFPGVKIMDMGLASLYFDETSGDLLGWEERWPEIERVRRITIEKLEWDSLKSDDSNVLYPIPKDMKADAEDAQIFLPPGQKFADYRLIDEKGQSASVATLLKGSKGAIVTVGSPGCGPCERTKEFLGKVKQKLDAGKIRVIVIEANCDSTTLKKLAADTKLPFPTFISKDHDDLRQRYQVYAYPTTYFIDADGRVMSASQNYDPEWMSDYFAKLGVKDIPTK